MPATAAAAARRLAAAAAAAARSVRAAVARRPATGTLPAGVRAARPPRAACGPRAARTLPATLPIIPRAPRMVAPRVCAGRIIVNQWCPADAGRPAATLPAMPRLAEVMMA